MQVIVAVLALLGHNSEQHMVSYCPVQSYAGRISLKTIIFYVFQV